MRVQDRAHEFRIVIEGTLRGSLVRRVADTWASAVNEALPRGIAVDISAMTGCDAEGLRLLREMYGHGTLVVGSTPLSLEFLAEITEHRRARVKVLPKPKEPLALKAVAGG